MYIFTLIWKHLPSYAIQGGVYEVEGVQVVTWI